jgi:hypothetical protein
MKKIAKQQPVEKITGKQTLVNDISTYEMTCKMLELCDNAIVASPSDAVRDEIIRLHAHVQAFYETEALVKVMNHFGADVTTTIEGELVASHIPFVHPIDPEDPSCETTEPVYDNEKYSLIVYPPDASDYYPTTWAKWAIFSDTPIERDKIVDSGIAIDFIERYHKHMHRYGFIPTTKRLEEELREILGIDKDVKSEYIAKQIRIRSIRRIHIIQRFYPYEDFFFNPMSLENMSLEDKELLAFIERGAVKEDNSSQPHNTEVYDEKNNSGLETLATLVAVLKYYKNELIKLGSESKARYKALSPFKKETDPSFDVYSDGIENSNGGKNTKYAYYHCHTSKEHGNVIDFVRWMEHCDIEAAKIKIKEILGIPIQPKTRHINLDFGFARRVIGLIWDKNDHKPFDKNMFYTFAGVYNQYEQSYGKLDKETQKSIKNNMLKASIDRYIQKELDFPLIDFYGVILWAESVGIIEELTPDLKDEAELVVNGEISSPTKPLKVNTDEDVVLAKEGVQQKANIANPISYSFQMLGGIQVFEGQYERPKLSTPYIPEWKSDTGREKLEQKFFDHATKIQFSPFIYSPVKLNDNLENDAYCWNYSDTYRDGSNFGGIYITRENTITSHPTCSLGIPAFQLTHYRTTSNNTLDSSPIEKPNIESSDVLLSPSSSAIVKEKNLERKTSIYYTNTQEKSVDFSKCPATIDGYSKKMLNYLKFRGISKEQLIKYRVRETLDGELLFTWWRKAFRVYNPLNPKKPKNWGRGRISKVVFGWEWQERLIEDGKNKEMCIVTKSPKDALALSEMEFDTIAPMSEGFSLPEEVMDKLLYGYTIIVFLYDNDDTGRKKAKERVAELLDRKPSGKETKIVKIFFPKDGKGKDVSDRIYNIVSAGTEVEDAVKTVKNEIEQLIATKNDGVLMAKKEARLTIENR